MIIVHYTGKKGRQVPLSERTFKDNCTKTGIQTSNQMFICPLFHTQNYYLFKDLVEKILQMLFDINLTVATKFVTFD